MADLNRTANFDRINDPFRPSNKYIIPKNISLGSVFNVSKTGPVNIFTTDLTPNSFPAIVKIWVDVNTALDLILLRTKGGVTKESTVATLAANKPFTMEIPFAESGETFNFRTNAGAGIVWVIGYASAVETITYK